MGEYTVAEFHPSMLAHASDAELNDWIAVKSKTGWLPSGGFEAIQSEQLRRQMQSIAESTKRLAESSGKLERQTSNLEWLTAVLALLAAIQIAVALVPFFR